MVKYRRLLIDRKQRQLLLESEVTKQFPFLTPLLEDNDTIGPELVKNLPDDQKIFFQDTLPAVLKQSQGEWFAEKGCEDYGETTIPCSLCETKNRYIYYITNKFSGKSMNVGSECINKFFDDISKKRGGKQGIMLDRENARKVRRLNDFYQHFPGAEKMLDSWIEDLDMLPMMIPAKLETNLKECKYQGKFLIKEFQERTRSDQEIINDFRKLIEERTVLWEQAKQFSEKQRHNPWAISNTVYMWLIKNNKRHVLDAMNIDCLINISTFSEIWEPNFLESLLPKFNKILAPISFKITGTNHYKSSFTLDYKGNAKVTLEISFRNLLLLMGPKILGTSKGQAGHDTHDTIIMYSSVKNERDIEVLLNSISKILRQYDLVLAYYQPEMDEIYIVDEQAGKYKTDKLSLFLKTNMGLILKYRKPSTEGIVKEVRKGKGSWQLINRMSDFLNDRYGGNRKWYPIKEGTGVKRLA